VSTPTGKLRGADVLTGALARAGVRHLFSLSGNHIMPVYDAALDSGLQVIHVRHEGAAVHMADAWGRLTGEPGIALLTGGPGHANGIGALYTALAAESPMVLLSGHAPLSELGRGSFQEMSQEEIAAPLTKASWVAGAPAALGVEIARAIRIARSGRPGPVHVSLPFDVLEATVDPRQVVAFDVAPQAGRQLGPEARDVVLAEVQKARRPIVLTGPAMANDRGRAAREKLAAALGVPVVCMESPRGVNDPCLGAFADVLREADLLVMLGKQPDFTLRFGGSAAVAAECRFILLDPDPPALGRAAMTLAPAGRVMFSTNADPLVTAEELSAGAKHAGAPEWARDVAAAINHRPAAWRTLAAPAGSPLHPVEIGRAVQGVLDGSREAVLVADGGEFGQWAQACVKAPTRLINGPAGSIGSAIPFALAARLARPDATVVAMLGDGTFGFHASEFDTAMRHDLPFVAVVGNDACWNAEYQIQLRSYGKARAQGCELLPVRCDEVAKAFGGAGEHVTGAAELPAALARAAGAGRAACVNVPIERAAAPVVTRRS
jgi:acetolactate synthase-1/2/3 large subunit